MEERERAGSGRMGNHLSPWDMSGLGMGFGLYRPRRPSYTFATQQQRQRSESYRYAVRKSTSDLDEPPDLIEAIMQNKSRKESYIRATRTVDPGELELRFVTESPKTEHAASVSTPDLSNSKNSVPCQKLENKSSSNQNNHTNNSVHFSRLNGAHVQKPEIQFQKPEITHACSENHIQELKQAVNKKRLPPNNASPISNHSPNVRKLRKKSMALAMNKEFEASDTNEDSVFASDSLERKDRPDGAETPTSDVEEQVFPRSFKRIRFKKNLTFLCLSFILIFSAFRAIQNLQSSINSEDHLGIIAMSFVHGTMFLTCLWAPMVINNFTAKWTLVLGMFSFILWIGANLYPRFYTLIPFGIIAGVGQGILWTAESSYILKLAFDATRITKEKLEKEVFRFHGIFLACFQTTHIWGNLISSAIFHTVKLAYEKKLGEQQEQNNVIMYEEYGNYTPMYSTDDYIETVPCGVLYPCEKSSSKSSDITKDDPKSLIYLMCAYIGLGFIAFLLIMLCLDKIGARVDPDKSGYEIVVEHVLMIKNHKTFRLLVPLLIFSGMQQAFVFSDFNQAYVTCTMGEEYIGYSMIVLGLANVISAILVAVCANLVPREVVFGIGGIIHMGLMIGLLIWIPEKSLTIFFFLSASWGLCDAVWQTQCNTLICITCPEDADMAFANYRMLQSLGLTIGFLSGTFLCVSFKLYILMVLLIVAILFYVLAEYRVRQVDGDIFEGQVEVN